MAGFIARSRMRRYSRMVRRLCDSLDAGQAIVIRRTDGGRRCCTLCDVDAQRVDREDRYYADSELYVVVTPGGRARFEGDLCNPPWLVRDSLEGS